MVDLKFKHGIRPSVRFKHTRRTDGNRSAMLGKVCIIGAFPTVSDRFLTYDNLAKAREELNITPDVNDLRYTTNEAGELVDNVDSYYYGAAALRWAFMNGTSEPGASEVLICNISTQKLTQENGEIVPLCDGEIPQLNTTLKHETLATGVETGKYGKLKTALKKLRQEEFDNLIFAYPVEELATNVKSTEEGFEGTDVGINDVLDELCWFAHQCYATKHPIGMYLGIDLNPDDNMIPANYKPEKVTGESVVDSVVETNKSKRIDKDLAIKYANRFKDKVHKIHTINCIVFDGIQTDIRDYTLTPFETAAYLCGLESGLPVDTVMGQRTLPHVIGVPEELNYDPYYTDVNDSQNDGIQLLGAGITCFECTNRSDNTWAIVNSVQPCGFDISQIRTSAYIIKQIALTPFLCKLNHDVTRESIDSVISSIKDKYIERFDNVIGISHHIAEKRKPYCVEIFIYINFYGIIIDEIVYVAMGVEEDE